MSALNKLLALNEVKDGMEALRLKSGIAIIVSPQPSNPKEFSIKCENATLREVLNAIARAQGFGVWEYIETHCGARNDVIIKF